MKPQIALLLLSIPITANAQSVDNVAIRRFFDSYHTKMPNKDIVTVCSAHGCQYQQRYRFKPDQIAALTTIMNNAIDPSTEREALRIAVAYAEQVVGPATGTDKDKAWLTFWGNGDKTQLDCTDEAVNITGYLIVMHSHHLIRYHNIEAPVARYSWTIANHYGVVITEIGSKQQYIIDGNVGDNGSPPSISTLQQWLSGKRKER